MNKKVIDINENKVFPFKQPNINIISAYYLLKLTKTR